MDDFESILLRIGEIRSKLERGEEITAEDKAWIESLVKAINTAVAPVLAAFKELAVSLSKHLGDVMEEARIKERIRAGRVFEAHTDPTLRRMRYNSHALAPSVVDHVTPNAVGIFNLVEPPINNSLDQLGDALRRAEQIGN